MSHLGLGWHRAGVGRLCRQARGQLQLPAAHQRSFGQERQGCLPGICLFSWGWPVQHITPSGDTTLLSPTPRGPTLSRQDHSLPTVPTTQGRILGSYLAFPAS